MFNPDDKKKSNRLFIACCVIFVSLFAIVNITSIATFFKTILSVISPILIGAAIAYLLNPLLRLYEFKVFKKIKKKNVCRGLSLTMTFLTALLGIVAFIYMLVPSLIQSIGRLIERLPEYLETATKWINLLINRFSTNEEFRQYLDEETILNAITKMFSASGNLFETILGYVKTVGLGLVGIFKTTILSIFIAVYLLISKERIFAQANKLSAAVLPTKTRTAIHRYIRLTNRTFGDYFIGVLVDACFVMVFSLIIFLIFGIPHALFISVIIGATNIIPIFGPFIGGIPSFCIVFLADPKKAFILLILMLVIQQVEGNIIAPKILGNSTKLSSLGVIIAITIMGEYFGLIGMIIGVPIFSMIVSIARELIEARLRKADLPTDTAHYYTADSMVDPNEHHERFATRIVHLIVRIAKKIASIFMWTVNQIKKIWCKVVKRTDSPEQVEQAPENNEKES